MNPSCLLIFQIRNKLCYNLQDANNTIFASVQARWKVIPPHSHFSFILLYLKPFNSDCGKHDKAAIEAKKGAQSPCCRRSQQTLARVTATSSIRLNTDQCIPSPSQCMQTTYQEAPSGIGCGKTCLQSTEQQPPGSSSVSTTPGKHLASVCNRPLPISTL